LVEHETSGARPGVLTPGVGLQKLAGDFDFTEGPTCDAAGKVFFTDQPTSGTGTRQHKRWHAPTARGSLVW